MQQVRELKNGTRLLNAALLLVGIYQQIKFQVDHFYSFVDKIELSFLERALFPVDICQHIKIQVCPLNMFRVYALDKKGVNKNMELSMIL